MTLALAILGVISTVLPFVIMYLKKQAEVKDEDHTALNQLGADEFHAGVTGGVQQPPPPLQPK